MILYGEQDDGAHYNTRRRLHTTIPNPTKGTNHHANTDSDHSADPGT